eukprot:TRINITY_DN12655_c1_g2_i1.p1 TRINITY_DN12655_c1_g2~~TRINITY_DN12655_c1_g2_i1.p1  ORF type:complete len:337 (-),score=58.24 TRINITY_DN12655_c1_g2_i1:84-995(-)
MKESKEEIPSVLISAIAGLSAGSIASVTTCPFDVIRIRMASSMSHHHYTTFFRATRKILYYEGLLGFYKGLGANLIALAPNWSIYFVSYNYIKQQFQKKRHNKEGNLTPIEHAISASVAAIATDITVNPLWLVKTRLQTQFMRQTHRENIHQRTYEGIIDGFIKIVRNEGFFALWKGITPQLIGVLHVAIQFPLYEYLKKKLKERRKETDNIINIDIAIAPAVSKIIASVIAYPHEVLRSRFQYQHATDPEHYHSLRNAIVRIYQDEGIRGYYKGIIPNLFRVIPSATITFMVYEIITSYLAK